MTGSARRPADVVPIIPIAARLGDRDDDQLVVLARGGHAAAFEELIRRHQAAALRIATRWLGDLAAGKDAVQSAFERLYRALPAYRCEGRFVPYLHRVVINECRIARRKASRYRRRLAELEVPAAPTGAPASDDELLARESRREIDAALQEVGDKLRDVLVLRFVEDLSYQQIADALELPVGTVKSRLFAGLERLRAILDRGDR
jgi:RNA polymerase sigma-70 factor, ECF subfamily